MKIVKVEAIPVSVPLEKPFVTSQGMTTAFKSVIVRITTNDGIIGIGECVTSSSFRDETFESIKVMIDHYLGPAIKGLDPFDIELLFERMTAKVTRNFQTKAGIDMALFDLQGKILDLPIYRILGGAYSKKIGVDYTLSADAIDEIGEAATKWMEWGYSTLVVKLKGDIEKDVERFQKVREAVGWKIKLRADANQCYTPSQAIRVIHRLERYEPELIEQPVKGWDLLGMAKVVNSVDIPISADESLVSFHDAFRIIQTGAADILNIKVPKNGGVYLSKKISSIAEAADMPCLVGGMMTFEIGRQASRHFAACTPQVHKGYASEGCGPASQPLSDRIAQCVITYDDVKRLDGFVEVTDEPGLGIKLDAQKLKRYQVHVCS